MYLSERSATIDSSLQTARQILAIRSESAALDAHVLLAHITAQPKAWLLAHPDEELNPEQFTALAIALDQAGAGIPLPYIIGEWEFFGKPFKITPDTLIPRPETELLVETALNWLYARPQRRCAADIGTGSGIIAVSLAIQIADLQLTATDISDAALAMARQNAALHDVSPRINFQKGNLLDALPSQVDLLCANLPYIPTQTLHGLAVYQIEPTLALDGGADGLDLIRALLADAPGKVNPGGLVLLEIEARQGAAVRALSEEHFPGASISVQQDLAGHDRLVVIEAPA